jgi:cardiolipin synthase
MAIPGWLLTHYVISIIVGLVTAGFLGAVLGQRRPTGSAFAWLLVILFVPYLGIPLYLVFGGRKFRRRAQSKSKLPALATGTAQVTTAKSVTWLDDGILAYEAFLREIRGAKKSIRIVTFVVGDDPTGRSLMDALAERAAAGVEVRLLLDDFLRFHAPHDHLKRLEAKGGEVRRFMPLVHVPFRGHGNLRNHRKIALFDGERGIVGGMNLADEYMGPTASASRWRDLSTLVTGDALKPLAAIFEADWQFASGTPLTASLSDEAPGPISLRVVPSGPDAPNDAIYDSILTAIFRAESRFWVSTPYFIPDEPLVRALSVAAHRGVGARLPAPHDAPREGHACRRIAGHRGLRQLRHAQPLPRLRDRALLLRAVRGSAPRGVVRRHASES